MAGGRWHVPTASSAKAREGADAVGQPCRVWDLSVHPAACQQALASARHKVGWPAGYDLADCLCDRFTFSHPCSNSTHLVAIGSAAILPAGYVGIFYRLWTGPHYQT